MLLKQLRPLLEDHIDEVDLIEADRVGFGPSEQLQNCCL